MTICEIVRERIQEELDGATTSSRSTEVVEHLLRCTECRDAAEGLRRVQVALRSLPEVPLPDAALRAVWERTIGDPSAASARERSAAPSERVMARSSAISAFPDPHAELAAARRSRGSSRPHDDVFRRRGRAWWLAAAAAVLAVAIALWIGRHEPSVPAGDDLAAAERDARLALSVAAHALKATEATAVKRVLAHEVSPALRRIPVRWSRSNESDEGRGRT